VGRSANSSADTGGIFGDLGASTRRARPSGGRLGSFVGRAWSTGREKNLGAFWMTTRFVFFVFFFHCLGVRSDWRCSTHVDVGSATRQHGSAERPSKSVGAHRVTTGAACAVSWDHGREVAFCPDTGDLLLVRRIGLFFSIEASTMRALRGQLGRIDANRWHGRGNNGVVPARLTSAQTVGRRCVRPKSGAEVVRGTTIGARFATLGAGPAPRSCAMELGLWIGPPGPWRDRKPRRRSRTDRAMADHQRWYSWAHNQPHGKIRLVWEQKVRRRGN